MKISALAKAKNKMPKEKSKTQIEKKKKAMENYRPKIGCEKCKGTNTTLYKIQNKYYCINCKNKIKNDQRQNKLKKG